MPIYCARVYIRRTHTHTRGYMVCEEDARGPPRITTIAPFWPRVRQ